MALDLNELQKLLDSAQTAAANDKEVRKALVRVENLISNVTKEVTHIYSLLDGNQPTPKATSTGLKKDGSPRKKPGRKKNSETVAAE